MGNFTFIVVRHALTFPAVHQICCNISIRSRGAYFGGIMEDISGCEV